MIEWLLARMAAWWTAGILTGLLGPAVSQTLQDIALAGAAFGVLGAFTAKIVLPASRALRASVQAPARIQALEDKFDERFDRMERKFDPILKHLHRGDDDD